MAVEIILHDLVFEPYISAEQIDEALSVVAKGLNQQFEGQRVTVIGVLDGAFMVVSDLLKKLDFSLELEFVKFKSYHGQESSGQVSELLGLAGNLEGKQVLIVEDIIDTGNTLSYFLEKLEAKNPASVTVCTLLIKEEVFQNKFPVDYKAISIDNKFVVGYGMDYDGLGRQLPEIYAVK